MPVISIGNLTTGGVGKTPMVSWCAEHLLREGRHPIVAMRGYGARPGEPSDEQAEYAVRIPTVPVVANPDRVTALTAYLKDHPQIDVVVLDDGFQHRRLDRDLDLVLIDATAATFGDRLLPAGHLREPPEALARADAVVMTHAEAVDTGLADLVRLHHGAPPIAWCRHVWVHLWLYQGAGEPQRVDVGWLQGRRVLTLLGVGRPDHVRRQLEAAGARVAVDLPARDHARFDLASLAVASARCEQVQAMVVTGKDWVKLAQLIDLSRWPVPIVVPELRLEFVSGRDALRSRLHEALAKPHA